MSALKNVGASVHQRLKNASKESGRLFNDLVQYYALERWLYRLSQSEHEKVFILKGALMLVAWRRQFCERPVTSTCWPEPATISMR